MIKKLNRRNSLENIADIPIDNLIVEVKIKSDKPVELRAYTIENPFVLSEGKKVDVRINDVVETDAGYGLVLRIDKGILILQETYSDNRIIERGYNLNNLVFLGFLNLASSPVVYDKRSHEYKSRKEAMKKALQV